MAAGTVSQRRIANKRRRFSLIPEGKIARKEALWFWFFISPWVIGFTIFTIWPMIFTFYLSFTAYNISSPPKIIAFSQNYVICSMTLSSGKSFQKVSATYTIPQCEFRSASLHRFHSRCF